MKRAFHHHREFFRQFRQRFETTGAVAPSSRFLARAMTWPMGHATAPRRVLEVGPGTGAVTNRIVQLLEAEDRLDLVEINEQFADLLKRRFEQDTDWKAVADRAHVHVCPLQEFQADEKYDFIISGLPLNNFSPELVREILETCFNLLNDGGVLSYFEYMYVRPVRRLVSRKDEKERLTQLDAVVGEWQEKHRFERNWVFANIPPAWVQHLRKS